MDQLQHWIIGPKAFILTYNNISCSMISKGAWVEYSQVEMLLGALPRDMRPKAVMKLKLYA